ncbi:MAG: indolepyruvate oxidoreductase subunit beta [Spirochaetae bacterium HGW-Spirochaetae-1]|jgi:indolepyruvate ferredoxin oxidoreductase beta subunit|nr:MAG: indolepyruvate oxidoreductase subunit beta [Spirochaetae bacterium HGW-Spirochaetae-1]
MNVIFAGVGGQGVILASKILMEVAMQAGYDVKESEVHGMAQRGGSVDCHVRFDKKVYSPLIEKGTADYIVSLETLEVMRKLDYLAPNGTLIVNRLQVNPAPVETGAMKYPDDLEQWVGGNAKKSLFVDTEPALKEAGSKKALNIVMLGVLSNHLEFSDEQWDKGIKSLVKEKFVDMNLKAFRLGKELK